MDAIDLEQYGKTKFYMRFDLESSDKFECTINKCEDLPPYHGLVFEEYNVDVITYGVKFNLKIITSKNEKHNFVRRIILRPLNLKHTAELVGCLNYIKRKRDVKEGINLLVLYGSLQDQREKLGQFILESEREHFSIADKNDGIYIKCTKNTEFYFDAKWTIWWNCRLFTFVDVYDIKINKGHVKFYNEVKPIIVETVKIGLDFASKKARWTSIIVTLRDYLNSSDDEHSDVIDFNEQIATVIEIFDSEDDDEDEDVLCVDASENSIDDSFVLD